MVKPASILALCVVVFGCASTNTPAVKPPEQAPIVLPVPKSPQPEKPAPSEKVPETEPPASAPTVFGFADLPGWKDSDPRTALMAFKRSCAVFARHWEEAQAWKAACELSKTTGSEKDAARAFFETSFIPQQRYAQDNQDGLLTAYYEPELEVRHTPEPGFDEPVFARPPDLVTVDPKRFDALGFKGRKLMGRVVDGVLVPYFTRAEIMKNNIKPLAWGRAGDVFFLQVQGSGRLRFEDGTVIRAAFAGHNGQPYTSIGKILIEDGLLDPGKASKGAIELWMHDAGPQKAKALMNRNARYVFFAPRPVREPGLGPVGTQGAPLTAGVSLAVDPGLYSLGSPIWVDTRLPRNGQDWKGQPAQFLGIAQDTGGAIHGQERGDLFLGSGDKAGKRAGIVKHAARWWVLVPRALTEGVAGPKT